MLEDRLDERRKKDAGKKEMSPRDEPASDPSSSSSPSEPEEPSRLRKARLQVCQPRRSLLQTHGPCATNSSGEGFEFSSGEFSKCANDHSCSIKVDPTWRCREEAQCAEKREVAAEASKSKG